MNTNKIRKALERVATMDEDPRFGHTSSDVLLKLAMAGARTALAELDAAPKVLTDEEIHYLFMGWLHANYEDINDNADISDLCRKAFIDSIRYARDNGYLAPSAELTVESITLEGEQPDPVGEIKVLVVFSDGTEIEAIRTCANSIYHMVTWSGLMDEHARLTAAIEAKHTKP